MALEFKDRVSELSATTGTGTIALSGAAPAGFRTFAAAGYTTGATVRYSISNTDRTEWEVGQGVWSSSGATLTRARVYASSNGDSLVNFSAGEKSVMAVPLAHDFVRPAFRAYRATTQSISSNTLTKVQLTSVEFDTCAGFDATTNYRWTPTVAGYYSLTGAIIIASASRLYAAIYKNGSQISRGNDTASGFSVQVTDLVYLNGSTDYVELWGFTGNSAFTPSDSTTVYFAGALISAAV